MSTLSPAQQARAAELLRCTPQQLVDHILALEAAAETSPPPVALPSAVSASAPAAAVTHATRKNKRPHSNGLASARLDPSAAHSAAGASTAPSTSPLCSPASPAAPPPKQQRLAQPAASPAAAFDYWSYPVRHIALRFLYQGTPYYGFSAQANSTLPTVESALFDALLATRLIASRVSCHYQRCGRTDRGVHAGGQVVSLWLRSRLKAREDGAVPVGWVGEGKKRREKEREERRARGEVILIRHLEDAISSSSSDDDEDDVNVRSSTQQSRSSGDESSDDDEKEDESSTHTSAEGRVTNGAVPITGMTAESIAAACADWEQGEFDYVAMLNKHLPPTVRVLSYHPVPLSFSARFSCHRRTYHYLFYRDALDVDSMRAAGALLVGKHDWRNFCTYDLTAVTHFVRRIHRVAILPEPHHATSDSGAGSELDEVVRRNAVWRVEVEGKGFLYHQVRSIVSLLFAVGRREEPVSLVARLLDVTQTPHKPAYRMASERGLVLQHSRYDELSDGALAWPTPRRSVDNLVRCYTTLFQQQRLLHMEAAVVAHMAAAVHSSLLRLHPSGLLHSLPFQLDDRVHKRWLCGGELLREANLQRSFAEQVQGLRGKKRERRQKVDRLREAWRRKEGEPMESDVADERVTALEAANEAPHSASNGAKP